jgi:predicted Zn finger-like uncharacterized protein
MFKVVPDQLKISEGWVRCGHCAEVFDASAHLLDSDAVDAVPPMAADTEPASATEPMPIREARPPAAPAAASFADEPIYPPFVLRSEEPEPAEADPPDESLPSQVPREPKRPPKAAPPAADVSFVRQARRKAYWRRRGVRMVLLLLALVLGALLAAQYAVQDRDRLAATRPALRPAIEALCQPLQCQVGPPRQIESIVIDSSTFNKLRGDAYRLSFALKNQASMPVAMPAIELTLTDSQDQPVVRRVLSPSDMGASSALIGPQADWSATLALNVAANSGRIAGYRLLAFYP